MEKQQKALVGIIMGSSSDLNVMQQAADVLNEFDSYLENSQNQFDYSLESGDILLFNNTFLLHNRTAFINSEIEGQERLLVRTWIDK